MAAWTLSGAFDGGRIRGRAPNGDELDFHQLEVTGHADHLESDYRLLREEFGLTSFRDGAWLERSYPRPGEIDWSYLDRLAAVSRGEVFLTLTHYEWPRWLGAEDVLDGRRAVEAMAEFAARVVERYRGSFAGYIPVVESGYWTAMITHWGRWWPAGETTAPLDWWRVYRVVGPMMIAMARAIRQADPDAEIALSEPWSWDATVGLDDLARPFQTLLGAPDPVAVRETGSDDWGGDPSLLQIVGLNFYNDCGAANGAPLALLLLEARRRFASQRIWLGETGNCHSTHHYSLAGWLEMVDDQIAVANAQGAAIEAVTWSPIVTLGDFDSGLPAPGAWVTWDPADPTRRRRWDPELARLIGSYAQRAAKTPPSGADRPAQKSQPVIPLTPLQPPLPA